MKTKSFRLFLLCCGMVWSLSAAGQSDAFRYQGQLLTNGEVAQGQFEVRFTLLNAETNGSITTGPVTNRSVNVTNGLFTTLVDFGTNVYDGTPYWLELAFRPAATADAFIALAPLQALTPVPYALHVPKAKLADKAKSVEPAAVDTAALKDASVTEAKLVNRGITSTKIATGAVTANELSGDAVTTEKIADGSVGAADLDMASFGALFWRGDGNAGTTPGTHFIGTTDNQPLEFKVNGQRVLRFENNGDGSDADALPDGAPNVLGGSHGNYISPNTVGATIAGGGATNYNGFGRTNSVRADYGTVGGGFGNHVFLGSVGSIIAGGTANRIGTNAQYAVVGGGSVNTISTNAHNATVAGGSLNDIGSNVLNGVISGGFDNNLAADARYATVAGGFFNNIGLNSSYSAIGGGNNNSVPDFAQYAMIPGGFQNRATTRSFAAGTRSKADHPGAFVWADSQDMDFLSTSNNQFNVRASGGVRLETGGAGMTVDGQPVVSGQVSAAQIADGAIGAAKLAAGAVDASRLADGAAAANLQAGGQSGVAGGGIILSEQANAASLLAAGYTKLGTASLEDDTWQPRNTSLPPTARSGHTAVWTGGEMIVWGGVSGVTYPTIGGRYDPATDTWTEMSTSPAGRRFHTTVWTGTEMIIWGGTNASTLLASGARYNPTSNTWRSVSNTNAPAARSSHTAVWTGAAMLIWGGDIGGGQVANTGGLYDPVTDSWTPISTNGAPDGRSGHSAVWTGSQMIIWGGQMASTYFDTGARYDPASQVWTDTPINDAPVARTGHAAVWTGSEMIVWGGSASGQATDSGGRYNPLTELWTATSMSNAPAPSTNIFAARVWTGTEMIVWTPVVSTNAGGRYNPLTDQWTLLSTNNSPLGRAGVSAVWSGTEMLVWGGTTAGRRYRPSNNGWLAMSAKNPGPSNRSDHTAVWTGSEMIVWGGEVVSSPNSGGRYSPASDTWVTMPSAPSSPGLGQTAVWTGSEMIVWGGEGSDQRGGRYFPGTDTWVATSPTPRMGGELDLHWRRRYHSAVWTGSEMIVWGGLLGSSTVLSVGYRYQLANDNWERVDLFGVPLTPRYGHSAVWTGTDMIIWGGTDGSSSTSYTNTGARYSPSSNTWTRITVNNAPAARGFHTAVWTGSEMIIWGGQTRDFPNRPDLLSSGGRYNPVGDFWTPITTNGAPTARVGHTAVWTGTEMIVWGGDESSGPVRSTTGGRYDPASGTWTPMETVGAPGTTENHTAVWAGSGMLVFGGNTRDYPLNLYSLKRPMYLYLKP